MAELSYPYRPSVLSSERLYTLLQDGIAWSAAGRDGFLRYGDVAQVRIFQRRFLGSSATYWTCVLLPRTGRKLTLGAEKRIGFKAIEDRTSVYAPFIRELEARVAAANPDLRIEGGDHWLGRIEVAGGHATVWLSKVLRRCSLKRVSEIAGRAMRRIGPRLRGHRVASEQAAIAFPEKSPAEIERIVVGMWDNLGRIGAEYPHLDRIWDFSLDKAEQGRVLFDDHAIAMSRQIAAYPGPVLLFGAHIGNWEVSALAGQILGREVSVVYKAPKLRAVAGALQELRSSSGSTLLAADETTVLRIRDALKRGQIVGMLVDEYNVDGVEVTMFGRPFKISPLFARFVRMFDCPFHGFHVIREPDGRFRMRVTEAIVPPRDAAGRVDVAGTMQAIVSTIEGWVRAHPEQWLWLHRRWR